MSEQPQILDRLIDALAQLAAEDYLRTQATPANDSDDERTEHVPLRTGTGTA